VVEGEEAKRERVSKKGVKMYVRIRLCVQRTRVHVVCV